MTNGDVIELFMWGYQKHAQISLQVSAESIFKKLDIELDPKIFFVGVLVEDRENRHPICIEPDDTDFYVSQFTDVKRLANELEKIDSDSRIIHSHPIAQENQDNKIKAKAYRDSILKTIERESSYGENDHFVSYPTNVEGYLVFTVLSLNKRKLEKYYSLTKDKWNDRFHISRSFIESCIDTFLDECTHELKDPNRGISFMSRKAEELLRDSARNFMYSASNVGGNFEGLHGLYDTCNEIASMKYEGAEGLGGLVVAPSGHKNIRMTLELKKPIKMRNHRKVRKFLELVDSESYIISDSALIYGLGKFTGKYNPKDENIFVISFKNHLKWELLHDENSLMLVEYGIPSLPKEKINRDKFYDDFPRLFKGIEKKQIDALWEVTMEATKQKHGAMLIISAQAETEAKRLESQCFPLEPLKLNSKLIAQTTSIDGGVLMDENAICHAIGVILDGIATEKGDSSRGSRYNSAVRYNEHFGAEAPVVIVVISEDGMINLIPELKPQIKHSVIIEAIDNFEDVLKSETLNKKKFNTGMSFFKSINFYLTEEDCKNINSLRHQIEEKFAKDLVMLRIVYQDITPYAEMNDSYYKEE
ncbi:DNA integrity scanning protein DisA nucleotide-binding domain protein [Polaribacter cellanae]|uniref:DNA integrity scanning protein DisA nucleotide-binding domain protein n=1 Tax=Polaribacter cellanae TaxID=2818493 RepID=A0A975CM74_9FLAO|nr:diadenylate cyclase [Polaribacter cellanae]QTE21095.1 DNA integrity scanning protein DisA nucleotide-binding domain protein [Polaribacter cellanae]